jgi:glycosyltransferase 2 family protein
VKFTELKQMWSRPAVRRSVTIAFLAVVAVLLVRQGRTVDWNAVLAASRSYPPSVLALALLLAGTGYLVYSCYDLLGRRYLGLRQGANPGVGRTMTIAFVAYAFNQSFGALIGTVSFRLRLYSKYGLDTARISRLIALSIVTNWLGYAATAGTLLAMGRMPWPQGWEVDAWFARSVGILLLTLVAGYMLLCAVYANRELTVRNLRWRVPTFGIAIGQLLLSMAHWPLAALIVFVLLGGQIEFVSVLGALLLAAVAVVLTHVPAGVGVLEAVFVGLLSHRMPSAQLLAALLMYRAVYYLLPLMVAIAFYIGTECAARPQVRARAPTTNDSSRTFRRPLCR